MKSFVKIVAVPVILTLGLSIAGCGKKEGNEKSGGENKPNLSDAVSPQGVKQAQINALPQADKNTPIEKYVAIESGQEIAFLYYAMSGLPNDYDKLAWIESREFRDTQDGFKKQEILQAIKPKIDAKLAALKANRYYSLTQNLQVGHYDFKTKSFPVSGVPKTGSASYFDDFSAYKLGFNNGDEFANYKVEDVEKAKQIESLVTNGIAGGKATVYLYAQDTDSNDLQVKMQIVKVVLKQKDGTDLINY